MTTVRERRTQSARRAEAERRVVEATKQVIAELSDHLFGR
jgi:hypothetical protein